MRVHTIIRNSGSINAVEFQGGLFNYSIKDRPDWAGSYVRSTYAARIMSRWFGAKTHRIEAWKRTDWLILMKNCDQYPTVTIASDASNIPGGLLIHACSISPPSL